MVHNEITESGAVIFTVLCINIFHQIYERTMFTMVCRRNRLVRELFLRFE